MAEQARREELMTLDAFLSWDDGTDMRYELIDGRVVAMNPPVAPHARLLSRMVVALESRMPAGCGTYTVGGTIRPGDNWNCRVPDVTVSCRDSENHWVEEPRIDARVVAISMRWARAFRRFTAARTVAPPQGSRGRGGNHFPRFSCPIPFLSSDPA